MTRGMMMTMIMMTIFGLTMARFASVQQSKRSVAESGTGEEEVS